LAEAFIIGEDLIENDNVCLVLGDNIFFGHDLSSLMSDSIKIVRNEDKATIFGYYVNEPNAYGVVEFDEDGNVISIEEKPENPK